MFPHKRWLYILASLPFIASVGTSDLLPPCRIVHAECSGPGMSITIDVALTFQWQIEMASEKALLVYSSLYLPFATVPSILVNIIVTTSISAKIISARRRLRRLTTGSLPSDTFSVVGVLVEAALPSSILGMIVPISGPATRVLIVCWVSCTVRRKNTVYCNLVH